LTNARYIFKLDKHTGAATMITPTPNHTFHSLALNSFPDSDADGIPDFWEDLHGLNKYDPFDAALDGDGDGLSNLEQFLADMVPASSTGGGSGSSSPGQNTQTPEAVPALSPWGTTIVLMLLLANGVRAAGGRRRDRARFRRLP
jgi:hypothetical protein